MNIRALLSAAFCTLSARGLHALPYANYTYSMSPMIAIEGRTFVMGRGTDREHSVTVSDFEMATMDSGSCHTWFDAIKFCNWRSTIDGYKPCYSINGSTDIDDWGTVPGYIGTDRAGNWDAWLAVRCDFNADGYRLPTEAEWEYAARGGNKSHGYAYSGSDNADEAAGTEELSGSSIQGSGQKKANELGLYDMSGNLEEWCWDWHNPYSTLPQKDPSGYASNDSGTKVLRGGSSGSPRTVSDSGYGWDPGLSTETIGFRLCRSITAGRSDWTQSRVHIEANEENLKALKPKMIKIESTEDFLIGKENGECFRAAIQDFLISETELSRELYALATGKTLLLPEGNLPAADISWYEAAALCNRLSILYGLEPCYRLDGSSAPDTWNSPAAKTGVLECDFCANGYRLPTEAEWEYAAHAAHQNLRKNFAISDNPDSTSLTSSKGRRCWYKANSGGSSHGVLSGDANPLGIYCMSGNIQEWCWDWYGTYPAGKQMDPEGAAQGIARVLRGGSWASGAEDCTIYSRGKEEPGFADATTGLRLCRSLYREAAPAPKKQSLFARIMAFLRRLFGKLFTKDTRAEAAAKTISDATGEQVSLLDINEFDKDNDGKTSNEETIEAFQAYLEKTDSGKEVAAKRWEGQLNDDTNKRKYMLGTGKYFYENESQHIYRISAIETYTIQDKPKEEYNEA